ncbi:efflux RND transporter permease subunit [Nisaea nitritireducens]|uniref:efflux RND transporter permease subunit n=1 Tax=Nisaea nitritireducens TaxID=568392 RepID=UPI00186961E3|nr:efflux RND transporter permease subunit [Nisaea nitritireducens]
MNLAAIAIEKKTVTYFAAFLLLVGGISSFFNLGQLEDPDFTIKTAVVATTYPGASPEEVELEVTDRLELAIQELKQIDYVKSFSRAGYSQIWVNIKPSFSSGEMPQIWDELRRKVGDTAQQLPPGAGTPQVIDDFGDVYGLLMAVTGDGFSHAEVSEYVDHIKKELSLVEGVARIDLWGVQDRVVYLDVRESQLSELGLSDSSIVQTLNEQNIVVDAGALELQNRRLRVAPSGSFATPEDIGNVAIRPSTTDLLRAATGGTAISPTEIVRIGDIGTIREGYIDPPRQLMRFNGIPAIGIAIANQPGTNVVTMGERVDARLAELVAQLPIGIELQRVHWQSDVIDEAVSGFFVSLAQAVAIVLVVLTLAMGWRMGAIIGTALIMTILATLIFMNLFGIDLQRMSLGALVIALGMMVDNAIVVADGMAVRLQKGMPRKQAAIEAANQPAWPLLGATIVAVLAFFPIAASDENAGEYCASLFSVVGISLMASWLISVTVTPLQCIDMLPAPKGDGSTDPFDSRFYRLFRTFLARSIRLRWLTLGGMAALLVLSVLSFGNVSKLFFPDSAMTKLMVDYWAPEGTRIQDVALDLERIEEKLATDDRIEAVTTFAGSGPPRFYLPVEPEALSSSYGQLIVNVRDAKEINAIIGDLTPWFAEQFPDALVPMRKFGVGPGTTWKFDVRFSGPAEADPAILRSLADEGLRILAASPLAGEMQTNWRQRVQTVVPRYAQVRAGWSGISREDIADATKLAFDGRTIGLYREQDELVPIIMRKVEAERQNVGGLEVLPIRSPSTTRSVPLAQVTDGIATEWEDPVIWRRDRKRTIKVQSNPVAGVTLPTLRAAVVEAFDKIELPPGYSMEWGGEYESSRDSQASLLPGVVPAVAAILFIIVALFNAFRPPLIILATIPFVMIGITAGLLGTGTPFGFVALLGAMSLAGMMIKNAIVLLDEINLNLSGGMSQYDAVLGAGVSRLRPVVLAAATTVLGVVPLLQDVFWVGMSVTIMAGLTFGTFLTMVLVPVLYAIFYRVRQPAT